VFMRTTYGLVCCNSMWFRERRRFGGTYGLHLHCRRVNQVELGLSHTFVSFKILLLFGPEDKSDMFLRNARIYTNYKLQPQKTIFCARAQDWEQQ
jgi:hypothetical protein